MTKKTINCNWIKVSGKFPIERKILLGEDVKLEVSAGCVKKEIKDNQDGTCDVLYVLVPIEVKEIR
jgi:hypothetical protein